MIRKPWTPNQIAILRDRYPHERTADVALATGHSIKSTHEKAKREGLSKSAKFMRTVHGAHAAAIGIATRIKPGNRPWNTGLKGVAGKHPNTVRNHFKPGALSGRAAQIVQPLGTYVVNGDGYLDQKVSDTPGPRSTRWKAVHRLVWEAAHGPVPAGHAVIFRSGRRTTVLEEITLDALELVSRADLMRRNTVHRYGPEIFALYQLKGAIARQINAREK